MLLLHKLGFKLPADAGSVFARIPDFWTADMMYSLAKKLGSLDKCEFLTRWGICKSVYLYSLSALPCAILFFLSFLFYFICFPLFPITFVLRCTCAFLNDAKYRLFSALLFFSVLSFFLLVLIKFDVTLLEDFGSNSRGCHHATSARNSLSSISSLEFESSDMEDSAFASAASGVSGTSGSGYMGGALTPVAEIDADLEKAMATNEIFAVPKAKHCNSIIR